MCVTNSSLDLTSKTCNNELRDGYALTHESIKFSFNLTSVPENQVMAYTKKIFCFLIWIFNLWYKEGGGLAGRTDSEYISPNFFIAVIAIFCIFPLSI